METLGNVTTRSLTHGFKRLSGWKRSFTHGSRSNGSQPSSQRKGRDCTNIFGLTIPENVYPGMQFMVAPLEGQKFMVFTS
jgi:hypothetical protein